MNRDRAPHSGKGLDDETKRRVELLAWLLQLVAGFLVGCGVGWAVARLLFRPYLSSLEEILVVAAGVGLVCGAFTSFHGNRAWMATSIFVAPEPAPPRKARACSLIIGGIGVGVVLLAVVHHWVAAGKRNQSSSAAGFDVFLLLAATILGALLVRALRTGTGFWRFGILHRDETPLFFWIYVLLNVAGLLSLLSMML